MKLAVVGIGRLGLCFALNLNRSGFQVVGYDCNADYVSHLKTGSHDAIEPDVNQLLKESDCHFTTTWSDVEGADVVFIMANTPSLPDGGYDHSRIDSILDLCKSHRGTVVLCSTVMPGYCDRKGMDNLVYNPQFVAQGTILRDQLNPDVVLIGAAEERHAVIVQHVYSKLCQFPPKFCVMNRLSAELSKLALNCYITTKITFANMLGDLCIRAGADVDAVLGCVASDSRVGHRCFKYGYGFGGPCFPRDNAALIRSGETFGSDLPICRATADFNKVHLINQVADFYRGRLPSNVSMVDGKVVVHDVSYKPKAQLIEESQPLLFAVEVAKTHPVVIRDTSRVCAQLRSLYGTLFEYEEK